MPTSRGLLRNNSIEAIREWHERGHSGKHQPGHECQTSFLLAEVERLRARLCYVNPDGSHVRGCAQHEAQHPAQWCETLARDKEC
jgi:hypothetical protein